MARAEVLLIGYGNPGRLDDGLGVAFVEALARMAPVGVDIEVDYQLAVEHAAAVARHRHAIFVDATIGGQEPFFFRRLRSGAKVSFSTHHLEPEAVLALAKELFGGESEGYALGIRGYSFEGFGEGLSTGAQHNLRAALEFMLPLLEKRDFRRAAAGQGDAVVVWNGESRCETENT